MIEMPHLMASSAICATIPMASTYMFDAISNLAIKHFVYDDGIASSPRSKNGYWGLIAKSEKQDNPILRQSGTMAAHS
jgi:hypothetical protein